MKPKKIRKTRKSRHVHKWETVQSFGYMGHRSRCHCGKTAVFIARD
ncbi:MAG TPA: hypothetical protein VFU31_19370 [Candidatus Binatia bacterium]|nr:hypothetical protein [Candidatus Binatia bacterium]